MKTAEQEKLEGNPGKRKPNENPPNKIIEVPAPPKYLGRIGARAYHDLTGLLGQEGMQVFSKSDYFALALICDMYEQYRKAKKVTEKDGEYLYHKKYDKLGKDENGKDIWNEYTVVKRHPAVAVAADSWKMIMSGLSRFGMTPYDRKRVEKILITTEETREQRIARRRADNALRAQELAKTKKHVKAI